MLEQEFNPSKFTESTKAHIQKMSEKFNITYRELKKSGATDMFFEAMYFSYAMTMLILIMIQYNFILFPYNKNTDLFIFSCIFMSKRMLWKFYYITKTSWPVNSDNWNSFIVSLMVALTLWFFVLLVKMILDYDFDSWILLILPIFSYLFNLRFIQVFYPAVRYQSAPYEVLHIIKSCIFYSVEFVWFWVFLPLAILGGTELYVKPADIVMVCLWVWGNSFSLIATMFIDKRSDELKFQAHFLGYWKKISEQEAYTLRANKTQSLSNKDAVIEYNNWFYKGMWDVNSVHSKPGDTLAFLLYFLFYTPERSFLMVLIFQWLLCFIMMGYACVRTQFLFPTIHSGVCVIVLSFMSSKKILVR